MAELKFDERLFEMNYAERLAVRVITYAWITIQLIATLIFLLGFSDVPWIFWLGVLSALYLLDRAFHYSEATHSLLDRHLDKGGLELYLTPKAKNILVSAYDKITLLGGNFPLVLTRILIEEKEIKEVLSRLEINHKDFLAKTEEYANRKIGVKEDLRRVRAQIEGLTQIAFAGRKPGQRFIEPVDLFAALASAKDENLQALFNLFEIDAGELERAVIFGRLGRRRLFRKAGSVRSFLIGPRRARHRIMNRAWTARPTPLLDQISTDLTDQARLKKVGFLIGHKEELDRLLDILSRATKPNALLVGEPGAGKETIVEHLAYLMIHDQVPKQLFDKRLVALDIGGLMAGADQGEMQRRIEEAFQELYQAGNVIFYIPEIHNLARTAGPKQITAAHTVLPLILGNDFPTIGTSFPKEFKQFIETDSQFKNAFEVIRVNEVSPEEAELILSYRSVLVEDQYKVKITFGAIRKSVELSKKYFRDRLLPASADDLLKEAVADVVSRENEFVRSEDVVEVAEKRVNIPIEEADSKEAVKLLNLEKIIHERLVNQEEAVKSVAEALREYRSGLARAGGPIAAFLFVGPTGVGKTELAKTLARVQFGSEEAMIRFDMSEYQNIESIHRLIGAPDGETTGVLTDAVRQKPYSLVLLDEFEKAHPDIWNLFLQVFDDGRLTDSLGRVVDFENSIIIATSNAHSEVIHQSLSRGESMVSIAEYLKKILVDVFHPELLNRFSDIIVFRDLNPKELEEIVELQLKELANLLQESRDVDLTWSPEAVKLLAKLGYEPAFGARPLRRVIRDKLREPLSEKIIAREINRGSRVKVDAVGEEIAISSNP
ncbi:MAG: ATP-dependent Clp protease ATP-binding subunit [Candidatus Colwellbacteria bacterium]|nr:ATP-dependent Clp protease ATP-binding subunit [Candidatus Colwellbacteria bacterium]